MTFQGHQFIGFSTSAENGETFQTTNPRTGESMSTGFHEASESEVTQAVNRASAVFREYRNRSIEERARFLEAIAEEVEALGDELLEIADQETALGIPRLTGERHRAVSGARMFAGMIREGSWVDARVEESDPDRKPFPKPDLRLMHRPIGPVVVFGASNFPFAISVVGTDTVSALAAGCPVVVKAHPAHAHTCEMLATAVVKAAQRTGMPDGVFSMVQGVTHDTGIRLVEHPKTEVVAFTGSLGGGRALADVAARRPRPIPFYGEMGSINPVFMLPGALKQQAAAIAEGFVGSLTLGNGQFCTNPGMVLGFEGEDLSSFVDSTLEKVSAWKPLSMLHPGIHAAYERGLSQIETLEGLHRAGGSLAADPAAIEAEAAIFEAGVEDFFRHESALKEEVFGPTSVVLKCQSLEDMMRFAESMDGSLSATLHGTEQDLEEYRELVDVLETRAGRLVFNGFPTGLEVGPAMHHGGLYPAASHPFFTSVGTNSIYRFVRPVSYQGFPGAGLPTELQDSNPRGIWRLLNGEWTKDVISPSAQA